MKISRVVSAKHAIYEIYYDGFNFGNTFIWVVKEYISIIILQIIMIGMLWN